MKKWLATLPQWLSDGHDCVLITITHVEGSTPREAGASMLVKRAKDDEALSQGQTHKLHQVDTIGGGHLEWKATQIAHAMLSDQSSIHLERFNLGARLGQCCGGLVWVLFEKISASHAALWRHRIERMSQHGLKRLLSVGDSASRWQSCALLSTTIASGEIEFQQAGEDWRFQQILTDHTFSVVIFGAGHVGEALVNALLPLQARIRWVDGREGVFPAFSHPTVEQINSDCPEDEVRLAPSNSYFLIMTHNHALDLSLCLALFKRRDFAYFGLIGSRSKRVVFERRLTARGVHATRLPQMVCPIGIQGISSKEPAAIAISVVAQLLQVRAQLAQSVASLPLDNAVGQS